MSVLGTGLYEECTYVGKSSETKTRFIQEATLLEIGADKWTDNDVVYVLLTEQAKKQNWDKSITTRKDFRKNESVPYSGLEKVLAGMNLLCPVIPIDIKDGKDQSEMWDIFNTIFRIIENGDELYFDLTHAFRYLPMLVLVLGSYAKFLKGTSIAYMSYGNYEARVKDEKDPSNDRASIVDLLPLSVLQDWTFATGQFIKSGNVDEIVSLGKTRCREIKKELRRADQDTQNMDNFVTSLRSAVNELSLCRGIEITNGDSIRQVRGFRDLIKAETIPALAPLIDIITNSFAEFNSERDVSNTYSAAKWCNKNKLYQQSLTFLREAIVSYICDKFDLDIVTSSNRELVEDILYAKREEKGNIHIGSPELLDKMWEIFNYPAINNQDILNTFSKVRDIRNDYNHAGIRNCPGTCNTMIKSASELLESISGLFEETTSNENLPTIFINYSNHPSDNWSSEQLTAAKEYGEEMVDLPFAQIDPEASEESISKIAESETAKLLNLTAGKNATVHIMGEMPLTFALVKRLQARGVRCVASTTERCVKESDNGVKESIFRFVRFREYEC